MAVPTTTTVPAALLSKFFFFITSGKSLNKVGRRRQRRRKAMEYFKCFVAAIKGSGGSVHETQPSFLHPSEVIRQLAYASRNYNVARKVRIQISKENDYIFTVGQYIVPASHTESKEDIVVRLDPRSCKKNTPDLYVEVFDFESRPFETPSTPVGGRPFSSTMTVEVVARDCILVAEDLVKKGMRPALLDMASKTSPGGGYKNGAGAQEENLFRRSNCAVYLDNVSPGRKWSYPVPDCGGFFVPNVTIIRGTEEEGYPLLEKPFLVDVICVAALLKPNTTKDPRTGHLRLCMAEEEITMEKIHAIFRIAIEKGITELVLSAFGCGAFCNPPEHVALLFRKAIIEYWGFFNKIIFAILDDHNTMKAHNEEGNILPFVTILSLNSYDEYLKADSG